jgi:SsrA-binding protein
MEAKNAAENRKARHEFFLLDRFEAGIELKGSEVKAIRSGHASLQDSYVRVLNGEAFVINVHILPYEHLDRHFAPEPARMRKLLLKRSEIDKLHGKLAAKGFSCVPLRLYFKRGYAKLEIAVCQRKKLHDKRETLRKRIQRREVDRALKIRSRKS